MLLSCDVGEDSWESIGQQGDPIFIGRTDAEAETPILWPPEVKNWLIGKDPDAGKDWRQEEKGMTEDEMVGWHHWLNGHEFGQSPGVGDGQGSLVCCSPSGCRVRHYWAGELNESQEYCWMFVFPQISKFWRWFFSRAKIGVIPRELAYALLWQILLPLKKSNSTNTFPKIYFLSNTVTTSHSSLINLFNFLFNKKVSCTLLDVYHR